jgi:hypothetical protein
MKQNSNLYLAKEVRIILFCACLFNLNLISVNQKKATEDENKERLAKIEQECQKYKLPPNAREMKLIKSFPKEELMDSGAFIWEGKSIVADRTGDIYVADGKQNAILRFDRDGTYIRTYGRSGEGPGDLNLPVDIKVDKIGNLHVLELGNRRIQIINPKGECLSSFKVFRSYFSFDMVDGNYLLPKWDIDAGDKVIDKLDANGRFAGDIAEQIDIGSVIKDRWIHHPRLSYVSSNSSSEVYLASRYFAEIRKYSADGKELAEFKIKHKKISDANQHNTQIFKNPRMTPRFKIAITAIQAKENGLYIFSPYPRIEILECLDGGRVTNTYWSRDPKMFMCTDFLIQENQDELRIYVLFEYPLNQVSLYTIKK